MHSPPDTDSERFPLLPFFWTGNYENEASSLKRAHKINKHSLPLVPTMHTAIAAGNYPTEIWPEIAECIVQKKVADWVHLVQDTPPSEIESPYFLLIDIHGFSKFCAKCAKQSRGHQGDMKAVAGLLRAFFWIMSEHIHTRGGTCVKFIGDAILVIHKKRWPILELGYELREIYWDDFRTTYRRTDVVVMITHPRECLKGFVGGSNYVDYSYWAPGLNHLFSQTKIWPHGEVYYVKRNRKVKPYGEIVRKRLLKLGRSSP